MNKLIALLIIIAVSFYVFVRYFAGKSDQPTRSARSAQSDIEHASSPDLCMESTELLDDMDKCETEFQKMVSKWGAGQLSGKQMCDAVLAQTSCTFKALKNGCGEDAALKLLQKPGHISVGEELCECCTELRHKLNFLGTALYISDTNRTCEVGYERTLATCVKCEALPALKTCDVAVKHEEYDVFGDRVYVKDSDPCSYEMGRAYCYMAILIEHCEQSASIHYYDYEPTGNPAVTPECCPEYFNYVSKFYENWPVSIRVTFNHTTLDNSEY